MTYLMQTRLRYHYQQKCLSFHHFRRQQRHLLTASVVELLLAEAAEAPVARCSTAQKSRRLVPFYDSCSIQLDANFFKQQLR